MLAWCRWGGDGGTVIYETGSVHTFRTHKSNWGLRAGAGAGGRSGVRVRVCLPSNKPGVNIRVKSVCAKSVRSNFREHGEARIFGWFGFASADGVPLTCM